MRWPIATAERETAVTPGYARYRPRLAMLGSPGLAYLRGLICAASIRQGFDVDLFPGSCLDYEEMLADRSSELCLFRPDLVLLVVDPSHLSGRAGSVRAPGVARSAREQLGAALVRNTVLPGLLSLWGSEATRSNAASSWMMEAIERQVCSLSDREQVELVSTGGTRPELLIQGHVPPIWRRRKPQSSRLLLNPYPAGRTFAALFGLAYSWAVVDVNHHPWMEGRDLHSFLRHWGRADLYAGCPHPDSLLFVDYDPFASARFSQVATRDQSIEGN